MFFFVSVLTIKTCVVVFVLVSQGHQSMYNPSNGLMDLVIKNTGHWGDRVYPGCGKVRTGMAKLLEPVYYSNVYGGGGDLSAFGK